MRSSARSALAVAAVFSIVTLASGQTQSRVSGGVLDDSGRPVANATIRLQPTDNQGAAVEAKTKKDGRFLIGMIRSGSYRLDVDHVGDRVVVHVKGRANSGEDKAVVWEIDQDISEDKLPPLKVGGSTQITLDIVVGPPSLTPEGKQQAAKGAFDEGMQLLRSGEYAGALAKFEPLVAANPDQPGPNYVVAFSQHMLGKNQEALTAIEKVIAKQPDFSGAHLLRGKILKAVGRTDDAEAELQREVQSASDPKVKMDSWVALASLYSETDRLPKAIEVLEQATAKEPRRELLLALADFYAKTGDRAKSAATLERAEKQAGGTDAPAMLNLAIGYLNDKKYAEAEPLARKILEMDATNQNKSIAHSILARCELNRGNNGAGIDHLEKAVALDPSSSLASENREILQALKKHS